MALFRSLTVTAVMTAALSAQSQAAQSSVPSPAELALNSPSGNYLAARSANVDRDAAAAAAYYLAEL